MMPKEKKYAFTCSAIPKRSFNFFEVMRNEKNLCDINIQIEDESISAHRIIIAAVIPYFRDVPPNPEPQKGEGNIRVPNVNPDALKCLIEFAYTHKMEIHADNVRSMLATACFLGVHEVQEACCEFLADCLEPENVFNLRKFASHLNCWELSKIIDGYFKQNFYEVSRGKDFLNCPFKLLKDVIGQEDLNVANEEVVFDAVLRWVKESPCDRADLLPELLRKVRMPLIQSSYLANVLEKEKLVQTSLLCRLLVKEAKNYRFFPPLRKSTCSFSTEPRVCLESTDAFQASYQESVYKLSAMQKCTMQNFDPEKTTWITKASKSFFINDGSAVEVQGKMYFFNWGNTLQYDPMDNTYGILEHIPTPRNLTAAAPLRNKIYVCGGKIGNSASDAVECYDPRNNKWEKIKSMRLGRWALNAVSLGGNIFVLGGKNSSSMFNSVERYDQGTDNWRVMSPMLAERSYAGAATLKGKIYVCGGIVGCPPEIDCISTAEVYNPTENTWQFISAMNSGRFWFTLLPCRGKLFAIGGQDDNRKNMSTFEIYDPQSDEWTFGPSTQSKYFVSAAVILPSANV